MRIIVTGGGTGGHIYPAIAIADKFKEEYPDSEILYVGVEDGLESRLALQYGYDFKGLKVKGFQRKISFENVKVNDKKELKISNKLTGAISVK